MQHDKGKSDVCCADNHCKVPKVIEPTPIVCTQRLDIGDVATKIIVWVYSLLQIEQLKIVIAVCTGSTVISCEISEAFSNDIMYKTIY